MSVLDIMSGSVASDAVGEIPIGSTGSFRRFRTPGDDSAVVSVVVAGDGDAVVDRLWVAAECPAYVPARDPDAAPDFQGDIEVCT